jgi:hypothetical protein
MIGEVYIQSEHLGYYSLNPKFDGKSREGAIESILRKSRVDHS